MPGSEHSSGVPRNFEKFLGHDKTVHGYIRRRVTQANLERLTDLNSGKTLRAIDIGGGEGADAQRLQSLGHKVILIDPNESMINAARELKGPPLSAIIPGDIDTALALPSAEGSFDLVLSHGVLMYQDNPQAEVDKLVRLLKPGGTLSLLTKGLVGARIQAAQNRDADRLRSLNQDGSYVNEMGPARAYSAAKLRTFIENSGLDIIDWFGVIISSDDRREPIDEVSETELTALFWKELMLSRDPHQRHKGQMLQFIARKNA